MKYIFLVIFSFSFLFAFDFELTQELKKEIIPNKKAVLIKVDSLKNIPFSYKKIDKGYLILGDIEEINQWIDNNLYINSDKVKVVSYYNLDLENILNFINENSNLRNCKIEKIILLSLINKKIFLSKMSLNIRYKILYKCKGF